MTRYLRDPDGDRWPVTGSWCSSCGLPMTPIGADQTTHPLCLPGGLTTQQIERHAVAEFRRQMSAHLVEYREDSDHE